MENLIYSYTAVYQYENTSIHCTVLQVVHWNLFDLTLYKGLWVVVYLLNGHLSKDLAPKMGYQYQAYFCF